jgi:arylsulfatase A-like enzyme
MKPLQKRRLTFLVLPIALLAVGCEERPSTRGDARPNILFILIDSLRADHLRVYGYEKDTADTIEALARQGSVFDQHIATASQTVPSTVSIMTSQFPAEHGFRHTSAGYFVARPPHFPERVVFLAELFSNAGYDTAGYMGCPFLVAENGFAQGFQEFLYSSGIGDTLTTPAIEWMKAQSRNAKPFFLYIHYFDVHRPYSPPEDYQYRFDPPEGGKLVYYNGIVSNVSATDLEYTIAMYDAEIAYTDDQIARLLDALDKLGVRKNTVIVITADHGDEFMDHGGMGHGTTVYGELIRVPLIIAYPPAFEAGRRIGFLTRHIDLGPRSSRLPESASRLPSAATSWPRRTRPSPRTARTSRPMQRTASWW